jgi:hypothetical protein
MNTDEERDVSQNVWLSSMIELNLWTFIVCRHVELSSSQERSLPLVGGSYGLVVT